MRQLLKGNDTNGEVSEREALYYRNVYEKTVKSVDKLRMRGDHFIHLTLFLCV